MSCARPRRCHGFSLENPACAARYGVNASTAIRRPSSVSVREFVNAHQLRRRDHRSATLACSSTSRTTRSCAEARVPHAVQTTHPRSLHCSVVASMTAPRHASAHWLIHQHPRQPGPAVASTERQSTQSPTRDALRLRSTTPATIRHQSYPARPRSTRPAPPPKIPLRRVRVRSNPEPASESTAPRRPAVGATALNFISVTGRCIAFDGLQRMAERRRRPEQLLRIQTHRSTHDRSQHQARQLIGTRDTARHCPRPP